jgi:hypothetical protein
MAMTALEDESNQKNGVVVVFLNTGKNKISFEEISYVWQEFKMRMGIPTRMASCHYCYDDHRLYPFVTLVRFLFGSSARGRFLPHFGKPSEVNYELQTYGIPTQVLPMDDDCNAFVTNHLDWLKGRLSLESSESSSARRVSSIVVPRRFDVLFGRGETISQHTGNQRAFHIVEMNRERYERASKFEKTQISDRIVHSIQQSFGRFLKKDDGGMWVVVTREEAREKISHSFRRLRELETSGGVNKSKATKRTGHQSPFLTTNDGSSSGFASSEVTTSKRAKSLDS